MTTNTELIAELRYVAKWAEHHLDKAKVVLATGDTNSGYLVQAIRALIKEIEE